MASCFFIGHRETEDHILPRIIEAAEILIREKQVSEFYVGGYGGFDHLAGKAVVSLKNKYPNIRLYLVIPYHPADRPIETPVGYDGTFYPDGMEMIPPRYAISIANRKMVDSCDFLIVHVTHTVSNAYNLLEYAKKRQKKRRFQIINFGAKE